jgi:hypothetical protein
MTGYPAMHRFLFSLQTPEHRNQTSLIKILTSKCFQPGKARLPMLLNITLKSDFQEKRKDITANTL